MSLNRTKQWRRYVACFFPSLFLASDGNIPLRANARDGAPPPPLPRAGPTFQPPSTPPSFSTEQRLVTAFPSSSQYGAQKAYLDHGSTVSSFCPAPTTAAPLSPALTMALHDLRRSYLPTPAQVSLHNSRDVHVVKQTKTARLPSPPPSPCEFPSLKATVMRQHQQRWYVAFFVFIHFFTLRIRSLSPVSTRPPDTNRATLQRKGSLPPPYKPRPMSNFMRRVRLALPAVSDVTPPRVFYAEYTTCLHFPGQLNPDLQKLAVNMGSCYVLV